MSLKSFAKAIIRDAIATFIASACATAAEETVKAIAARRDGVAPAARADD